MRSCNIVGHKVVLRALEPEDLDIIYIWENDPSVWRYSDTQTPYSRYQLRKYIEQQGCSLEQDGQLRLVICRLATIEHHGQELSVAGDAVGLVDIFEYNQHHARAGVGIVIDHAHRNMGYAADALLTAERYLHTSLHLHQLWCNIESENSVSLTLFKRCGYKEIGIKKDWRLCQGKYCDEILFQKILNP